jgi:polyhydroxyalkanoate synthesis regulator phasin
MNESVKVGHVEHMIELGKKIYERNRGKHLVQELIKEGNIKSAYGVIETMCSYYRVHIS